MLGGKLGLASLHSWVEWEGGQGGPIRVVREGVWGITCLRFFIRGEYSALGCVEGVGWGEGDSFHSVSVLGVVASLLSSFGSCDSVEYTSGAGVAHLGFCIRGEYSILGCDDDVEWGEGGGLLIVSVLGVVASLLSSLGSCSSGEFTSGAATKTGGSLAMVGLVVSGRGWTVPLLWVGWTVPLMWVGWTVPLMWVGSKVFLMMKICLKINLKLSVVAFKVEVGINSSLPKAVKFSDEAV